MSQAKNFLTEQYLKRKDENPSYSLRSFAKEIGISVTQVSRVLSGQREMTYRQMSKVLSILDVPAETAEDLISGIILSANKNAKISRAVRTSVGEPVPAPVTYLPMARFKMVSQWYHFAILELTYVKDFSSDPQWIAQSLGISVIEAQAAIERLITLEFLERKEDGSLTKRDSTILFTPKAVDSEIIRYETSMLDQAKEALNDTDDASYQARLINSITFPTSAAAVPELKTAILDFQKSLLKIIKKHDYQEVYHFGCQLFPVSDTQCEGIKL